MTAWASFLDWTAGHLTQPLERLIRGDRTFEYVAGVERVNRSEVGGIADHQMERLRAICAVAARETDFYSARFRDAGITDPARITPDEFQRLPLLTRDDLRTHAERILNSRFFPDKLRQSATGGSTASPVRIYMDYDAYYRRRAATVAFNRWFGFEPGNRAAYLWGARQDFEGHDTWKQRLLATLVTRARFYPTSLLDDKILERYAVDLLRFKPRLLQAYPTPLEIFSRFLLKRGLKPRVPAISCTAEPMLPAQAEVATEAFGVRPFEWYGSRECGRVATECDRRDGMHINAYGLLVETVPTPGGRDMETVVITDLWNEGFPLIRYETADLGRIIAAPCACGSSLPRLTDLAGRVGDSFVNSRGQLVPGVAFTNRILKECAEIQEMQIIQRAVGAFEIRVVPGPDFSQRTHAFLNESLAKFMDEPSTVTIREVDGIPREASGKLRFCKSEVAIPPAPNRGPGRA